MKQLIVKKGQVLVEAVPQPQVTDHTILVQVQFSCISAGTEVMGIEQSGKGLIEKAMEQPQKVRQAIDIYKKEGIKAISAKVNSLSAGKPTGYSVSGVVVEVGKKVTDIKAGDRVACAGAGYANHAELIEVPRNLVMKVPRNLDMKIASTVTMGGIALQGVRRMKPELGEYIAVVGLGLLGQLSVQFLKACGCRVIGIDLDENRLCMAKKYGCDLVYSTITGKDYKAVLEYTNQHGVDGVLITAATHSNELLTQCFDLCRKKGRVVLVGVVGDTFCRDAMYTKELDFYISTSYGPGRYDSCYEEGGQDYPYAYVRWTENRNMAEYLAMLAEGKMKIDDMIQAVYNFENADEAFKKIQTESSKPLITILTYTRSIEEITKRDYPCTRNLPLKRDKINVALVGAGGFAKETHLPNLQDLKKDYQIYAIMSHTGLNAKNIADQYHAVYATTDYNRILNDENVDLVIICTRHNLHAELAVQALRHHKSVLLEKPLALTQEDMELVLEAADQANSTFMVGYNRRYSEAMVKIKAELKDRIGPIIVNYRMNAGYIPLEHWVHTEEGGGRIIGELCHIVDLGIYLTGSNVEEISINPIKANYNISSRDNLAVTLSYEDGSVVNIIYTALGNTGSGKEHCDIYCDEKTIVMNDYYGVEGFGTALKPYTRAHQDKGHKKELEVLAKAIRTGKKYPISRENLKNISMITFLIEENVRGNNLLP